MLTVHFEREGEELDALLFELGEKRTEGRCNFVLREDGDPIGLMQTTVGETVKIVYFNIVKRAMNRENREFFFRAKFGFVYDGKSMRILSSDIRLSGCHG